ncbi:hypothetical protein [Streptomyces sp. NPDC088789]
MRKPVSERADAEAGAEGVLVGRAVRPAQGRLPLVMRGFGG